MSALAKLRKLLRRIGVIDRSPRGGLDRDRTIHPRRGSGRVERSPFKKSRKQGRKKSGGDSLFISLVSALENQGYSRQTARRAASQSRGDSFSERFKDALRRAKA